MRAKDVECKIVSIGLNGGHHSLLLPYRKDFAVCVCV